MNGLSARAARGRVFTIRSLCCCRMLRSWSAAVARATGSPLNNFHAEIYYPPYLYRSRRGVREPPCHSVRAGRTRAAGVLYDESRTRRASIGSALVQTGSATHGLNLQQRFVELAFTADQNSLTVDMPARTTDTPPGYYLLFALNGEGVPSVGKIVKVDIPAEPPPQDTTPPSTPAGLAITKVQGNPRLIWNAATDNVGVAGYAIHRSTDGTVGPGNLPGRGHDLDRRYRCKRARSIRMRSRRTTRRAT